MTSGPAILAPHSFPDLGPQFHRNSNSWVRHNSTKSSSERLSAVSRHLQSAYETIRDHTLACIKQADPALSLSLEDFVELCRTHELEFL